MVIHNEHKTIKRCLESIKNVVDEIIIVHDGPCSDGSLDICAKYTKNIYVRPFIGIAEPHRVFSFEKACGDWILYIDADEVLSNDLKLNIRKLAEKPDVDLYAFLWPYYDGKIDLTTSIRHPYRVCMARKSKMFFIGIPRQPMRTYGSLKKCDYIIYHRPMYNNYNFGIFYYKWLPRNIIEAEYVWMRYEEIPIFGINNIGEFKKYVNSIRSKPLLKMPLVFFETFLWHIFKGMYKVGFKGFKMSLLMSLDVASVQYYIWRNKK